MFNTEYQTESSIHLFKSLISNIRHVQLECWIDFDLRYSRFKTLVCWIQILKLWSQFDILYSRFKKINNNVEWSLIIDIRQ